MFFQQHKCGIKQIFEKILRLIIRRFIVVIRLLHNELASRLCVMIKSQTIIVRVQLNLKPCVFLLKMWAHNCLSKTTVVCTESALTQCTDYTSNRL